ncbi:MAG: SPFH domain-containing protein [bacterium]|nr:SPFH domain-containing protein [bacterium]
MFGYGIWLMAILGFLALLVSTMVFLASRYKRCPSDRILVVFGKVGKGQSANCIHGGGVLVWPLIQDYAFLSLTPLTINIPLQNALSLQNIRINVPSTFTVGVSTQPAIMQNAAERLLGLGGEQIEEMAREIIFGQLRLTVASLTIEQINQDRESFLESIRKNVEPELNKIGLYLINVNITDITDESNYIESIGKKAASEAINRAKIDVAEQEKLGSIGEAQATREREIKVAENLAGAEKGRKAAEADERVFVQQQETTARIGEAEAAREKEVKVAATLAEAEKGRKLAEADQRVYVQEQEARAVSGENTAKANIADANAKLAIKEAAAQQEGEVARFGAEEEIERARAKSEEQRLIAVEVVREEIERRKVEIAAEARAEQTRREARGEADAVLAKYEAEAEGIQKVLSSKASGYRELVESCDGDAKAAATLLMIEKLEEIVSTQVEAIKNLQIDKITVWDSGSGQGGTGSTTSNFMSSLIQSLPPLHEVAAMAGVDLPEFLGRVAKESSQSEAKAAATPKAVTEPEVAAD